LQPQGDWQATTPQGDWQATTPYINDSPQVNLPIMHVHPHSPILPPLVLAIHPRLPRGSWRTPSITASAAGGVVATAQVWRGATCMQRAGEQSRAGEQIGACEPSRAGDESMCGWMGHWLMVRRASWERMTGWSRTTEGGPRHKARHNKHGGRQDDTCHHAASSNKHCLTDHLPACLHTSAPSPPFSPSHPPTYPAAFMPPLCPAHHPPRCKSGPPAHFPPNASCCFPHL
jgi:hypothetical protein